MKKAINWNKISENEDVIILIKEYIELEDKIRKLDNEALINYALEVINNEE